MSPIASVVAVAAMLGKFTKMMWSRVADCVPSPRLQVGPEGEIRVPLILFVKASRALSAASLWLSVTGFWLYPSLPPGVAAFISPPMMKRVFFDSVIIFVRFSPMISLLIVSP
jgi:hypothetical protein